MENTQTRLVIPSEIQNELPENVVNFLYGLDPQSQKYFIDEYFRKRRNTLAGYLLWFLGFHYAYYNMWTLLLLFWISCFLVVGVIWWIIDAFRIKDLHQNFNTEIALNLMKKIESTNQIE